MNFLKNIAEKMLYVKYEEESFEIIGAESNPYRITEDGLVDCNGTPKELLFIDILNGNRKIKRKPYIPELDDRYWYVTETGPCLTENIGKIEDMIFIACGNCYKTEEEAKAEIEEWEEKANRFFWGDGKCCVNIPIFRYQDRRKK